MSAVTLVPYSDDWPRQFSLSCSQLVVVFSDESVQVEHIGSTSVPGLAAKPVIDVLLGAGTLDAIEAKTQTLESLGYQYISRYERELPTRRYFTRHETSDSPRIHLHAVTLGSGIWREHIAFRDALRSSRLLRAEYHSLKTTLAARFPRDKASYTAAKDPFIRSVLDSLRPALDAGNSCKPRPTRGPD